MSDPQQESLSKAQNLFELNDLEQHMTDGDFDSVADVIFRVSGRPTRRWWMIHRPCVRPLALRRAVQLLASYAIIPIGLISFAIIGVSTMNAKMQHGMSYTTIISGYLVLSLPLATWLVANIAAQLHVPRRRVRRAA